MGGFSAFTMTFQRTYRVIRLTIMIMLMLLILMSNNNDYYSANSFRLTRYYNNYPTRSSSSTCRSPIGNNNLGYGSSTTTTPKAAAVQAHRLLPTGTANRGSNWRLDAAAAAVSIKTKTNNNNSSTKPTNASNKNNDNSTTKTITIKNRRKEEQESSTTTPRLFNNKKIKERSSIYQKSLQPDSYGYENQLSSMLPESLVSQIQLPAKDDEDEDDLLDHHHQEAELVSVVSDSADGSSSTGTPQETTTRTSSDDDKACSTDTAAISAVVKKKKNAIIIKQEEESPTVLPFLSDEEMRKRHANWNAKKDRFTIASTSSTLASASDPKTPVDDTPAGSSKDENETKSSRGQLLSAAIQAKNATLIAELMNMKSSSSADTTKSSSNDKQAAVSAGHGSPVVAGSPGMVNFMSSQERAQLFPPYSGEDDDDNYVDTKKSSVVGNKKAEQHHQKTKTSPPANKNGAVHKQQQQQQQDDVHAMPKITSLPKPRRLPPSQALAIATAAAEAAAAAEKERKRLSRLPPPCTQPPYNSCPVVVTGTYDQQYQQQYYYSHDDGISPSSPGAQTPPTTADNNWQQPPNEWSSAASPPVAPQYGAVVDDTATTHPTQYHHQQQQHPTYATDGYPRTNNGDYNDSNNAESYSVVRNAPVYGQDHHYRPEAATAAAPNFRASSWTPSEQYQDSITNSASSRVNEQWSAVLPRSIAPPSPSHYPAAYTGSTVSGTASTNLPAATYSGTTSTIAAAYDMTEPPSFSTQQDESYKSPGMVSFLRPEERSRFMPKRGGDESAAVGGSSGGDGGGGYPVYSKEDFFAPSSPISPQSSDYAYNTAQVASASSDTVHADHNHYYYDNNHASEHQTGTVAPGPYTDPYYSSPQQGNGAPQSYYSDASTKYQQQQQSTHHEGATPLHNAAASGTNNMAPTYGNNAATTAMMTVPAADTRAPPDPYEQVVGWSGGGAHITASSSANGALTPEQKEALAQTWSAGVKNRKGTSLPKKKKKKSTSVEELEELPPAFGNWLEKEKEEALKFEEEVALAEAEDKDEDDISLESNGDYEASILVEAGGELSDEPLGLNDNVPNFEADTRDDTPVGGPQISSPPREHALDTADKAVLFSKKMNRKKKYRW